MNYFNSFKNLGITVTMNMIKIMIKTARFHVTDCMKQLTLFVYIVHGN